MGLTDDYRGFAAHHLGRPLRDGDGHAAGELAAAEQRLGLELPPALRAYYLACGAVEALNRSHNRLLPPQELQCEDGHLVFMDENQGVCCWGLRVDSLAEQDPQVWQGVSVAGTDALEWHGEDLPCSQWLRLMGWWQLVNGGFAYAAYTQATPELVQQVRALWPLLGRHPDGVMVFHGSDAQLLAMATGEDAALWAAGRTRADLQAIDAALDIAWDYSTLDEE